MPDQPAGPSTDPATVLPFTGGAGGATRHDEVPGTATISVVVPVYRVERFVGDCVRSLAAQTRRPDQVVLVDDRGGDASMDVALAAARACGLPVTVVTCPSNGGIGRARNLGLQAATGDLVLFLDSDDTLVPDALTELLAALRREQADFASGRTVEVLPDGTELDVMEPAAGVPAVSGAEFARGLLVNRFRAHSATKLFRRSALPEDLFDVDRAYEDFLPNFRQAMESSRVALTDRAVLRYRVNPASVSRSFGRHTEDLFAVSRDVRTELADRDLLTRWSREWSVYQAVNLAIAVGNTAVRARHLDPAVTGTDTAIAAARALVRPAVLRALAADRRWRDLAACVVLKVSPRLYSSILRFR
ncbi:glycosyltransferase family 2 protein [Nakamurella leprariae]|uniref:Glycosyltransferase family 2 protein n=1 Tax=Nakamurella leprariae TaxID=2803911 RepID=A0A938YJK6_9ACTN|nr:glycosyltransferase family 2 protein [Nakamurella leprariae]MBM9468980.1 glycosyltransferase family 2 protein [Nakamurella leprariae]